MKNNLIATVLLAGFAFTGLVNAADGTINFTGNITDAACTITPSTANQVVSLGTVSSSAFTSAGSTASPTRFKIVLTACPVTVTSATVKFDGPADTANSSLLALTSATGVATGVAVGLYENDATTQVVLGSASASQALSATSNTTFEFVAKYVATNTSVIAGSANAVSDFTVSYN